MWCYHYCTLLLSILLLILLLNSTSPPCCCYHCCAMQAQRLRQATQLLGMFLHRSNTQWADTQQWAPPEVVTKEELEYWRQGEQMNVYKADLVRKLRSGAVAVQLIAGRVRQCSSLACCSGLRWHGCRLCSALLPTSHCGHLTRIVLLLSHCIMMCTDAHHHVSVLLRQA